MLVHTSGIVIKNTRYGENSVISKIFTLQFGMQTYMVNSIHGAKSGIKASMIQPLTILDLVVYHHKLKEIQRIKEARCAIQLPSLHFEPVKSGIAMFVSEVLFKVIKEEEANPSLYSFIEQFLVALDQEQGSLALWPLFFLVRLSKELGFEPENNFDEVLRPYFDLSEGNFVAAQANMALTIAMPQSRFFSEITGSDYHIISTLQVPKTIRQELMQKLILYYKLHIADFQGIKSVEVLGAMS